MNESDLFDYEPSRLRLADMMATREELPGYRDVVDAMKSAFREEHPEWCVAPRHRSITSARERLQSGHGIGMVMLCALGQMHDAEYQTTWTSVPRTLDALYTPRPRLVMSSDSGE